MRRSIASTFNAINDAIIVTDAAGRITQANNAVLRLFNRAPEDVIGDTCNSMVDEGEGCPHPLLTTKNNASNGDEGVLERESLNRRRDRALKVRVSYVTDFESGAVGFIHVIRDVTRERVIERHLIQAERRALAGQMVSAVAHEVATPLSVIANIAEMLRLDAESGSHTDTELSKIVTQARRVTEMMRGLLNFVRQTPAQYTAVDLGQLAHETLKIAVAKGGWNQCRCRGRNPS